VRNTSYHLGHHLWLDYSHSQRASKLVRNYGFTLYQLVRLFNWGGISLALMYAEMN